MIMFSAETVAFLLFFIGLYGLLARRSIIKSILSLWIMESAIILYFLTANGSPDAVPPIAPIAAGAVPADPIPQALTITAIVIGVAVTAVSLSMLLYLYHKYGTSNWKRARDKRMEDALR